MNTERNLTVREALRRPSFLHAQLAAGEAGLDRIIRWVHILEISEVSEMINGQEMILTTGVGLFQNLKSSQSYMMKLIDQHAACLCMEMGPYFPTLPEELVELANQHDFPLIVFREPVRFVDITQDLHSLIIGKHYQTLKELEQTSREFHRLTLTAQGTVNVLKLLQKSTGLQLLFRPLQGIPTIYPQLSPEHQEPLVTFADSCWNQLEEPLPNTAPYSFPMKDHILTLKPIGASTQCWAYLAARSIQPLTEYDLLLIDSAALSIAQELLRSRYMEERKLFNENLWVEELMNHTHKDDNQIRQLVGRHLNRISELHFRVCLLEMTTVENNRIPTLLDHEGGALRYQLSNRLRTSLEKVGYRGFVTMKNNRLAAIALDTKSKGDSKARLQEALETFLKCSTEEREEGLLFQVGVGKAYSHLGSTSSSHQEALQALAAIPYAIPGPILFYEELGIYQLLIHLNDHSTLQQFVTNYLGPILEYDQSKGSDLLHTLKVYLDHDGSKQIAAQKLFIVRQSLYYRLEKIKELLGEDYMNPENRISIQVALRAYRFLHPTGSGGSGHIDGKSPSGR